MIDGPLCGCVGKGGLQGPSEVEEDVFRLKDCEFPRKRFDKGCVGVGVDHIRDRKFPAKEGGRDADKGLQKLAVCHRKRLFLAEGVGDSIEEDADQGEGEDESESENPDPKRDAGCVEKIEEVLEVLIKDKDPEGA